jgi:hypothetical protein
MATRVSWALEETIISLVMPDAPLRALHPPLPRHPRRHHQTTAAHDARRQQAVQDQDEDEQQLKTHKSG